MINLLSLQDLPKHLADPETALSSLSLDDSVLWNLVESLGYFAALVLDRYFSTESIKEAQSLLGNFISVY